MRIIIRADVNQSELHHQEQKHTQQQSNIFPQPSGTLYANHLFYCKHSRTHRMYLSLKLLGEKEADTQVTTVLSLQNMVSFFLSFSVLQNVHQAVGVRVRRSTQGKRLDYLCPNPIAFSHFL